MVWTGSLAKNHVCTWFSSALLSVGERTLVDLGGSDEVAVLSHPEFPPAASVLDATPHPQAPTIPSDTGPERMEGAQICVCEIHVID